MVPWSNLSNQTSGYPISYYDSNAYYAGATVSIEDLRVSAREERERRRVVVHMPPPVILDLCTESMPEKRLASRPRGVSWLAQTHGGQREKRAARAQIERKDAKG